MCRVRNLYVDVTKCFVTEMCVYIYYVPMCIILSGEGGSDLPGCLKVSGCRRSVECSPRFWSSLLAPLNS